ncbi:Rft protein-domain-containing protein [Catenaria anguillulae PL171]|uniref:Man(5)GlcNAc(2)-PP-dolichol translocation protein RFT1 n=1 Tax=Catenaria anguillulae PL171 TaxID=765915 RepID=A0A1Y2HNE8_9FUNG|nr:Rft protein-domain-containing protein [Catenaria anguillulae PL171]
MSTPSSPEQPATADKPMGKVVNAGPSFLDAVATIADRKNAGSAATSPVSDADGLGLAAAPNSKKSNTVSVASAPVMRAAVAGAGSMFALQVFSKLITFFCNQLLLRQVTPEIFGIASIQLELLVSTLLFLAREPIRLAVLRVPALDENGKPIQQTLQRLVNLAWLPPLVGVPLAVVLYLYYTTSSMAVLSLPGYQTAVMLYALGSMCDLLSEPFYTMCFALMKFKARAAVEGAALTASCLTALYLTWGGDENGSLGIVAFGFARLAFGMTFLVGFVVAYLHAIRGTDVKVDMVVPRTVTVEVKENKRTFMFDSELLVVAWSFLKQSLVKHVLTEGDKIILSMFYTPYHQGVYAVIFNYGSIVARIVFLPLEDAARLLFSRMPKHELRTKGRSLLEIAIKFHTTLGLFAIVFGTQYSRALLLLLAGRQWGAADLGWSGAPTALAAYCWFIPILGVNGITEAFVTSVAGPNDLAEQNVWLIGGAAVFAGTAFAAYPLGATGLVIANAVHLLVRIVWSFKFIKRTVGVRTLKEQIDRVRMGLGISWSDSATPARGVIYGMGLAYLVAGWTRGTYFNNGHSEVYASAQFLAVGVGIASMGLFLVIVKDFRFALAIWDLVTSGQIVL